MDKMVYSQVLITCTTINVISIISMFSIWIADKLHDRRERKKKEREEQGGQKGRSGSVKRRRASGGKSRCLLWMEVDTVSDIKTLSIDIETYSGYDLNKCGVYKYVEHPDFDILLFGYAVNGGEVQVVDLACGEKIPEEVLVALSVNP